MILYQNNPGILSTFEEKLSGLCGQTGIPVAEADIEHRIDQCCLLMEEYVSNYGNGDRNDLQFLPDMPGGSGRGDVDQYNLLCDILGKLRRAAFTAGLEAPGSAHKFLAKDIMVWNDSFADDAFACGKVPGWEVWLARRRAEGVLA